MSLERRAGTHFAEQAQELEPLLAIGLVVVAEGVAARGVEDDRFLGEPPVAVLRPARPRQLRLAHRKPQPRVLDRRALAARRRADDGVPGQEVEPPLLPSDAAPAARLHPGLSTGPQRRD